MAARTSSTARVAPAESATDAAAASWAGWFANSRWTPWLIIALGAFLRILLLGIKPPHFDEGINGWFVDQMTKTGFYRYDPTNYHGPFHFYVLFLSLTLFGRNLWALRMPVVLASIFCVRLTFAFEPLLGRKITRWAALAMAVSPGYVFYGRYSIHEVWLLLFSMLFILGLLGLWRFGNTKYLWCAGMGLFGMILTKETYIMHLGCALLAWPVAWVTHLIRPAEGTTRARQTWSYLDLAAVLLVGVAAVIFFYSGTFLNFAGLKGLYQTFSAWFETGNKGNGHEKPWYYWLMLIGRYEAAAAIGLLLSVACLWFRNINLRYLAIYGVGTLAAYSIVAYKTPWCIISIVWPLLFVFGVVAALPPLKMPWKSYVALGAIALLLGISWAVLYKYATGWGRFWPAVLTSLTAVAIVTALLLAFVLLVRYAMATRVALVVALAASLVYSVALNYFRCTTETEPYVYVQTYNDVFKLTDPLLRLAHRNPTYYQLVGHIIRSSAYPLPWMLGDFTKVGYYEKETLPSPLDADFLLVEEDKIASVESKLHGSYYTMPLRIRPYQDTSKVYLSARVFKDMFPGRVPEFA
ncbi:MAG: TIGR03663 family protein, partial [Verrucomicrobiota bacterium]|nr:TIGR03663 family protein [Verrucomicrobiota bacterium]